MEVFLKKDVAGVGMAGQIIRVQQGFANNYLIPRNLGIIVTVANRSSLAKQEKRPKDPEAAHSETSILAEKIGAIKVVLRRKMHDDGKLYAAVREAEIVALLAQKGFKINKNQVIFERPIREKGGYKVIIKLSTKLQPKIHVDVVAE